MASLRRAVAKGSDDRPRPVRRSSGQAFVTSHFGEQARRSEGIMAMRKLSLDQRRALDDVTFADWLKQYGQSDATIARFWDLIVIPTLNDPSKRVQRFAKPSGFPRRASSATRMAPTLASPRSACRPW